MDLREFLSGLPHGGAVDFAKRLDVSPYYLQQLASRQNGRTPSPALCVQIERLSNWGVRRWDMRPDDWHLIWPELVTARDAPRAPDSKHVAA